MKRLLIIALGLLSTPALAQDNVHAKDVNVRVNVPGLFIGAVGGAADVKIAKNMSVGPTVKYMSIRSNKFYEIGVEGSWAVNGDLDQDGWLVRPYLSHYQANFKSKKLRTSSGAHLIAGTDMVYQWAWDNGFNTQVGVGVAWSSARLPYGIGGNGHIIPNLDLSVGYAFA